ncbi:fumarase, class II [Alkalispirochaeta americana]|uniref:Fumarate hydratase class II n=1 Tax=Alkalispirochaeta americana TaxID=159291 RepID=A0A1N6V954_9SPIO|nr:class II fumarate hydratase [Alkalispirochaeta americana]SIQ74365.1 fumarase, class II [Alkalispirochaeta americana]
MTPRPGEPHATRVESDTMGEMTLPAWALWGAQTERARENFDVSPLRIPRGMIVALGLVKKHAARANAGLGVLDPPLAEAIETAAAEIIAGTWNDHFPLDVFQTGSGTSWNMNINEVISNRANELLGGTRGSKTPIHPNDHVNRGQSSNDVIPTAIHLANRIALEDLLQALQVLAESLRKKEQDFSALIKLGRTHLQDAVPMTLGQEFSGFAVQIEKARDRIRATASDLEELALGGTALGTGLNCEPGFAQTVARTLAEETGLPFRSAPNKFEAIASRDAQVALMGALNTLATSLMKIANDLRLLASGPRGGLGEITLPSLQPGSSIMPGKVNPVIPEMVIQVAAHINGKALSVTIAGQHGPLELNMMLPLIAHETLSALELLTRTCRVFAERAILGIEADPERLSYWIEWSLALVTPLAREIGYDKAAHLAYQAYREKRMIRDVVRESGFLTEQQIQDLLDPGKMV